MKRIELYGLAVVSSILLWQSRASADCTLETFTKVLRQPFKYGTTYPEYRRPQPDRIKETSPETKEILRQTFDIAPKLFRDNLCEIDGIFTDTTGPWGYREQPTMFAETDQPDKYNLYITIPDRTDRAPNTSDYENLIFEGLLHAPSELRWKIEPDVPSTTVLAVLAHEYGHLLFRKLLAPTPGEHADPRRFCHGDFFQSWEPPINTEPQKSVAAIIGQHKGGLQTSDLFEAVHDNKPLGLLLHRLFTENRWASVWASFTPEHDFVETYALYILTHILQQFLIEIPIAPGLSATHDILFVLRRPTELAQKIQCFAEGETTK